MPVLPDSFIFRAGAAWQFPAFVLCLGSSYLQRMLAALPQLAQAAASCPGFEDYVEYLPQVQSKLGTGSLTGIHTTEMHFSPHPFIFRCL